MCKTYEQTILNLVEMLSLANAADSDNAEEWQKPNDARIMFNGLRDALIAIAGQEFFDYWCETNEIDFTLAE